MNKEFEFLKIINSKLSDSSYLGDDCAYLDEYKLAISQDSLIEDVHFSLDFMTPYEIARKALLVNISDILASGAVAEYVLISLGGKLNNDFIEKFYKGINDVSNKYSIKIIGGDLVKSDKIVITITIIGNYKNAKPSSRKNAKAGYVIAAAGEFGSSAKGLADLKKGLKDNYFIDYHKYPPLYPEISRQIAENAKYPYAMMDSSDGLIDCIYQICDKSNVGANIDYDKIPKKTDNEELVLYGGEDYALVAALSEEDFKNIKGLTKIGTITKEKHIFLNGKKVQYGGFKHFE